MSFCSNCGKVLSSLVEAQRQARGVKKRSCHSCGRSDELNKRYCIFCGSEIDIFVGKATNPAALAQFSSELNSLAEPPTLRPTESYAALPAMMPVDPVAELKKGSTGPSLEYFLIFGVATGLILPLIIGANTLRALLLTTQIAPSGLIMFTEKPDVNVEVESDDRTSYLIGQTSKKGVLNVKDLNGGIYQLRFNLPGTRTIIQRVKVTPGQCTVVAFENRVKLPKSNMPGN